MDSTSAGGTVLVERRGHALIVTLNRPDSRNAVNAAIATGIADALDFAEADPDVRAVVITGSGDEAFCAGADMKEAAAGGTDAADERMNRWGFAGYVNHAISKPTIAAVNGFALGGGTEIVLASDLAVAAETATFGLPEVTRGIIAGGGGAFRLAQQIPPKVAMEALLTGRPIPAARALQFGLVNAVVPREQVLDAALALAEAICNQAPLAVQATKRISRGIVGHRIASEDEGWAHTAAEAAVLRGSDDRSEGLLAFIEKRDPRWTGH